MHSIFTAFCALFLAQTPDPPYRAVVVDATTSQPLPGVQVVDVAQQRSLVTDAAGRFSLSGPTAHFKLQHLGFSALEATRPAQASGVVDTLRLLPQAYILSDVIVRPTRPLVLTSVQGKGTNKHGGLILPSSQFGIYFPAAASDGPVLVQEITLQVSKVRPTAGRVRIRLVAAGAGPTPLPTAHDLLPVAATYSAGELAQLAGQPLTLDVQAYQLRMPAQGLFVLVEGLPTLPTETFIGMENLGTVVTAPDPQNPTAVTKTRMNAFPSFEWASSASDVTSYIRHGYNTTWKLRQAANVKEADNLNISLVLAAD